MEKTNEQLSRMKLLEDENQRLRDVMTSAKHETAFVSNENETKDDNLVGLNEQRARVDELLHNFDQSIKICGTPKVTQSTSRIATADPQVAPQQVSAFGNNATTYAATSDGCSNATLISRERVRLRREKDKAFASLDPHANRTEKDLTRLKLARQHLDDLNKFKGDRLEWIAFEEDVYTTWDAGEYTDFEMIKKLRKALDGDAKAYVKLALNAPEANPEHVMETLRRKYYHPNEAVSTALKEITALEAVRRKVRKPLENLLTAVESYVHVCNLVRIQQHLTGRVNGEVESKLPNELQADWNKLIRTGVHDDGTRYVGTWHEFYIFLRDSVEDLPIGHEGSANPQVTSKKSFSRYDKARTMNHVAGSSSNSQKGRKPKSGHPGVHAKQVCAYDECERGKLYQCSSFWLLPYAEKIKFVNDRKICHRCVNSIDHAAKDCPLTNLQCKVANCSDPKGHSTVLHPHKGHVGHIHQTTGFTAFQVLPIFVYDRENRPVRILAFLDGGSDTTIMNQECFELLQLPSEPYHLDVGWCAAGVSSVDKASRIFDCKIANVDKPDIKFNVQDAVTMKRFSLPRQGQDSKTLKKRFQFLRKVPLHSFESQIPQMLIGLQQKHLMTPEKVVRTLDCPVVAELTSLGWTVSGSIRPRNDKCVVLQSCLARDNDKEDLTNEELHLIIRKFIDEDIVMLKQLSGDYLTPDDKRALELCNKQMKIANKRYHVGMYWTDDDVQLPDNYALAESRLISQELRLKKLGMVDWANEHIKMLLDRGYARKATDADLNPKVPHKRINYVPGFVTFNKNKSPPKPRWVVDPACKFKGQSLNLALLKGPDNLVPLSQALFHFRERKYATVADVEKMYHQVMILPEDQNCQRMLWRWCDTETEPEILIHQAMLFGPTDSPSKANSVRIDHANRSKNEYAMASRIAHDSTYMDDVFNSEDDVDTAVAAANESIDMNDKISWKLVDFRSNSPEILSRLPLERVNENFAIDLAKDETIDKYKVLGICWAPVQDAFIFKQTANFTLKTKTQLEDYVPTKREILSFVMRIYDPLGLISHLVVRGRMIMQKTWIQQIDFSEKVSDEVFSMWIQWLSEIDQIAKLIIPRHYNYNSTKVTSVSLHLFSDAGADGFASIAYFRFESETGIHVQQIAAKTKVSPIRYLSIAKKELSAAVASVKLAKVIIAQHKRMTISSTTYWSDSEITLKWIRNPTLKLVQFVAPRVTEIWDETEIHQWRFIPTNDNPADHGTKWKQAPIDYSDYGHRWFQGPQFLWEKEIVIPMDVGHPSVTKNNHRVLVIKPNEHEKYYAGIFEFVNSSIRADWNRYITAVAGMLRFIKNLKHTVENNRHEKIIDSIITPKERTMAMKRIILNVQQATWPNSFKSLSRGHFIKSKNANDLNALNPIIGEDGLLRSCTRLSHETAMPYDKRFPMILPGKHEVTDVIVRYYHRMNHHIGYESVIARLRETFWIVHVRQAVRRVVAQCQVCKEMRAKPYQTPRAPLPQVRVTSTTKSFENVGCDLFGPFTIFTRRSKSKRQVWCVIFCCLVTRAVYLRMIDSVSADEMMLAIQDIWTRRGPISNIYSDNGTNFVKCADIIRDETRSRLSREKGIQWHFNPPYSPQWGGAWERLIRDIKRGMKHAIGNIVVSEKVFLMVLFQIEDIMNSRPLTHIPTSPNDNEPLTPNLLIKLHPGYPLILDDSGDINSDQTIRKAQWYANQFRRRWAREYLPVIAKHPAKGSKKESIEIGDYVMYIDPVKHHAEWPKGVVVKVYRGRDGYARVADIKLPDGKIIERRSALRFAKLITGNSELFEKSHSHVINILFHAQAFRNGHTGIERHMAPLSVDMRSNVETEEEETFISLFNTRLRTKHNLNPNAKEFGNNSDELKSIIREKINSDELIMKSTPERAVELARKLLAAKYFNFDEIMGEIEGTLAMRVFLAKQTDPSDKQNKYTIKFRGFKRDTAIINLIVWLTSIGMRPTWIKIENINNKKIHVFVRNHDRAVNEDVLKMKEVMCDGNKIEVSSTGFGVDYFYERGYEHTIVDWTPNIFMRTRDIVISRVRDTPSKKKAMRGLCEDYVETINMIDAGYNFPEPWDSNLYDVTGRDSVFSRLGERQVTRNVGRDENGKLRSVIVVKKHNTGL